MDRLGRFVDQDRDGNAGEVDDDRFAFAFRQPPPSAITIVDDGDVGYSSVGGWNTYVGVGAQGDFAYKSVGTGSGSADWMLTGLAAGQYRVSVTWESYTNRAVDATYTVLDGATVLGSLAVDQRQPPMGFSEDGVLWQDLGTYQVSGGTLVVSLSDLAGPSGSYVIADAVRVERVDP